MTDAVARARAGGGSCGRARRRAYRCAQGAAYATQPGGRGPDPAGPPAPGADRWRCRALDRGRPRRHCVGPDAGALIGARRSGAGVILYSGELLAGKGARALATSALARAGGRYADSVLACSFLVAHAYHRRGVEAVVLHPPIEAPGDGPLAGRGAEERRRLGIDRDVRMVCSLGAITKGRGQDTLIEALAVSADRGIEWRLGGGGGCTSDRPTSGYRARSGASSTAGGLSDRVVFAGRVDDPQAFCAAADVFVNPARFPEPFGRAACEALVARCPVVSTRVGGAVEALRDRETALLVEPETPVELATAINELLDDSGLAERLAQAGASDVARRFAPAVGHAIFGEAVQAALAARAARSQWDV